MDIEPGRGEERKSSLSIDTLEQQIAADVENYIGKFSNEGFAVRLLAKKSDLSTKTIKRLRSGEHRPSYPTLFKLYVELTRAESEEELLSLCPPRIQQELSRKKANSGASSVKSKTDFDLYEAIKEQPVVGELYVIAAMKNLEKNEVILEYGRFGIEILEMLVGKGLLAKVTSSVYTLSSVSPQFDGKVLQLLSSHFIKKFFKPGKSKIAGENSLGFYADQLNENGLKQWAAIDEEAFFKKVEVAKKSEYQGDIPVFTVNSTDTLLSEGEDQ